MPTIGELVGGMLDRGYESAAETALRAIAATANLPIIAQRLSELDAEAVRLAESGEKLRPDNPVLRALVADLEPVLTRAARRMDGIADEITGAASTLAGNATRQLALPGLSNARLVEIGLQWNVPDPEAVARLIGYADKPGWADELAAYPSLTMDTLINQAVRGMVEGWSPLRVADNIRQQATALPLAKARVLTRTLYLESYRSATAAHQLANADILTGQIRIGTLDSRICLCCLSLHGQELPLGEKISDHHAGRCTSIAKVIGRPRTVQTGEEWYNGLTEAEQQEIAGPGAFEALKSGKASLRDFVQPYRDPVFGDMVRQASIAQAITRSGGTARPTPAPVVTLPSNEGLSRSSIVQTLRENGYSDLEIERWFELTRSYMGTGYVTMRGAVLYGEAFEQDGWRPFEGNPDAVFRSRMNHQIIADGLELLPPFRGRLVRGVRATLETLVGYDREAGTFTDPAVTSWSNADKVKKGTPFTHNATVLMRVSRSQNAGVSVRRISPYETEEQEVLVRPGVVFRVVQVQRLINLPPNDPAYRMMWERTSDIIVMDLEESGG